MTRAFTIGTHPDLFSDSPTAMTAPWETLSDNERFDVAMYEGLGAAVEAAREAGDSEASIDAFGQRVEAFLAWGGTPSPGKRPRPPTHYKGMPLWLDRVSFIGHKRDVDGDEFHDRVPDFLPRLPRDADDNIAGDAEAARERLAAAWERLHDEFPATCVYYLLTADTQPTPEACWELGAVATSDAELRAAAEALPPGEYAAHLMWRADSSGVPLCLEPLATYRVVVE